jgi:glycosyltransferase involved in cell wall biosynthesis
MEQVRAAFLPDTFHETNGVANTSRHLEAVARRRQIPFLSIHCGPATCILADGSVTIMQLKRGVTTIGLDAHLDYDPFLLRYAGDVVRQVKAFGADLVHVTGPGDIGILGRYVAARLGLPLVASWHTSLHEYAARRLERLLGHLPDRLQRKLGASAEATGLQVLRAFYRRAAITLVPNEELLGFVGKLTGRPVSLMTRGVDLDLFSPRRRKRIGGPFRLGYVGRLTAEKNVRFLAELSTSLKVLGRHSFEIVIVGEGREEAWLREQVPHAIFTGVLHGERLAEVYANMDAFVFPSRTDTFGNAVLEALASGVPAIVTAAGGPKFLIEPRVNGFVAESDWDFVRAANEMMTDRALHARMRSAARQHASSRSWDAVFEQVFRAYAGCLPDHSSVCRPILGNI